MESAPVLIKEDIKLEDAKRIKNMREEAGAEVEIREINEVNND
jgi:ribosomal protein L7/L12